MHLAAACSRSYNVRLLPFLWPSNTYCQVRQFSRSPVLRAAQVRDHYKTLGVSKTASNFKIKANYFELSKKYHPDRTDDPGARLKFYEVKEAYEVLIDAKRRAAYDKKRAEIAAPAVPPKPKPKLPSEKHKVTETVYHTGRWAFAIHERRQKGEKTAWESSWRYRNRTKQSHTDQARVQPKTSSSEAPSSSSESPTPVSSMFETLMRHLASRRFASQSQQEPTSSPNASQKQQESASSDGSAQSVSAQWERFATGKMSVEEEQAYLSDNVAAFFAIFCFTIIVVVPLGFELCMSIIKHGTLDSSLLHSILPEFVWRWYIEKMLEALEARRRKEGLEVVSGSNAELNADGETDGIVGETYTETHWK